MGIEFRRDRAYFYRKVRRSGRVVSEYAGGGVLALVAMERAEGKRAERAEADAAWRAERARMEAEDRAFAEYFDRVGALASTMLIAAGYHRPKRQWRKRRVDANTTTTAAGPMGPAERLQAEADVKGVLQRAIDGDKGCLPALDAFFDDPKLGPRLVEVYGDPARLALRSVLDGAAGKNLVVQGGLRRRLASLRAELEGPHPTPIERLLAERAAYCWLIVWNYEEHLASEASMSYKQADFHQRRIDAAHRRYLSSLRALATVRKLAVPDIRVEVGPRHHHHDRARPGAPCTCHVGSELPTFSDRLGAIR